MANCTMTFYRTNITPDKNALIDNLSDYLASTGTSKTVSNVQYFKNELETTIKLSNSDFGILGMDEALVDYFVEYNYVKVLNSNTYAFPFYYFITNTKWISESAIQLTLYLDTLNTFQNNIVGHFTEKTQIHRQHKDRFHKRSSAPAADNTKLMVTVDRSPEGINNVPLLNTERSNALAQNHRWILMYIQSDNSQTLTSNTHIYAIPKDTSQIIVGESLTYLLGEDAIDKAGTEIIKMIEFPYEPFGVHSTSGILPSVPTGWSLVDVTSSTKGFRSAGKVLRLDISSNLNTKFETYLGLKELSDTVVTLPAISDLRTFNKSAIYETKLYHSDFHKFKFVYDNYAKEIRYEDLAYYSIATTNTNALKGFYIKFYPSNNMSSKLMFKFEPVETTKYKQISDYEEYLLSDRNLEPMRINDQFINYIRNGYNYDTKAHNIETTSSLINFGIDESTKAMNIISSGNKGEYGKMAGSFGSMLKDTNNSITKELLYENSLQAKLSQLAAQGATISGTDDLSLLNVYNGNKLLVMIYEPTERMKEVLFDKFYYTGYADEHKGIPNIDSRRMFNFIQCDPVFNTEKQVYFRKYLDDVKSRFASGVTVYHKYRATSSDSVYTWNLDDSGKENWETWICAK